MLSCHHRKSTKSFEEEISHVTEVLFAFTFQRDYSQPQVFPFSIALFFISCLGNSVSWVTPENLSTSYSDLGPLFLPTPGRTIDLTKAGCTLTSLFIVNSLQEVSSIQPKITALFQLYPSP